MCQGNWAGEVSGWAFCGFEIIISKYQNPVDFSFFISMRLWLMRYELINRSPTSDSFWTESTVKCWVAFDWRMALFHRWIGGGDLPQLTFKICFIRWRGKSQAYSVSTLNRCRGASSRLPGDAPLRFVLEFQWGPPCWDYKSFPLGFGRMPFLIAFRIWIIPILKIRNACVW